MPCIEPYPAGSIASRSALLESFSTYEQSAVPLFSAHALAILASLEGVIAARINGCGPSRELAHAAMTGLLTGVERHEGDEPDECAAFSAQVCLEAILGAMPDVFESTRWSAELSLVVGCGFQVRQLQKCAGYADICSIIRTDLAGLRILSNHPKIMCLRPEEVNACPQLREIDREAAAALIDCPEEEEATGPVGSRGPLDDAEAGQPYRPSGS